LRFIPVTELKGGEILAINIVNANKNILMSEGATLTVANISRLKKLNIKSIYINDDLTKRDTNSLYVNAIPDELKNNSINSIKSSFVKFNTEITKEKRKLKYGDNGEQFLNAIGKISKNLIDELIAKRNSNVAIMDIKNMSDYHFSHSINVAVLSLIIGIALKLSKKDMENLVVGALLIDIGCQKIDDKLFCYELDYNEDQFKIVKEHTMLGYQMLNENTLFNANVKRIVHEHHERIDGSGYPRGLKGNDISILSKIVMLADVYDAMISDRPHRIAHTQNEVFEHIMAGAGRLYDFEIANIFARKIIPYPVGTYVQLSNNLKGIVLENNENYPLRPILRIVVNKSDDKFSQYRVNLMETNNLTIKKVIYSLK